MRFGSVVVAATLLFACGRSFNNVNICDCGNGDYTEAVCTQAGEAAACEETVHELRQNQDGADCSTSPATAQVNCCVFDRCDAMPELSEPT